MTELLMPMSIAGILQEQGSIDAANLCITSLLIPKLELVGFVPHKLVLHMSSSEPASELYNMNSDIIVNPFRIRCRNSKETLPVMTLVNIIESGEFEINSESYIVSDLSKPIVSQGRHINTFIYKTLSLELDNKQDPRIVKTSNVLYRFTRKIGEYKVIAESFLCLCRYINEVTGSPSYILLSPNEVYKSRKLQDNG